MLAVVAGLRSFMLSIFSGICFSSRRRKSRIFYKFNISVAYAILFLVFDVHALERDSLQIEVASGRVGAYYVVDGDVEARFVLFILNDFSEIVLGVWVEGGLLWWLRWFCRFWASYSM